jgi:hypothetical protein
MAKAPFTDGGGTGSVAFPDVCARML